MGDPSSKRREEGFWIGAKGAKCLPQKFWGGSGNSEFADFVRRAVTFRRLRAYSRRIQKHRAMKIPRTECFLPLLLSFAPLVAAPIDPSLVPASAKWVLHVDLDAMRGSATGREVFRRIEAEQGAKLTTFKRISSVHLLNDVHNITLYGDGRPERGVALISGNFDRAHMTDIVRAADGYSESSHESVTLLHWQDGEKQQNAAFAAEGFLVLSRQDELLPLALDTISHRQPGLGEADFPGGDKPLVTAMAKLGEIKLPADASAIVRNLKTVRISASEGDGRFVLDAAAGTADAARAKLLRRTLDGIVALGQLLDPRLAADDIRLEFAPQPAEPGIFATLSMPVEKWIPLMREFANKKK